MIELSEGWSKVKQSPGLELSIIVCIAAHILLSVFELCNLGQNSVVVALHGTNASSSWTDICVTVIVRSWVRSCL